MTVQQAPAGVPTSQSLRQDDRRRALITAAACDPVFNARIRADLETAVRIQRSLLPRQSPLMSGVRFAWDVLPCTELAGDILDVFDLDQDHLAFYIVDVSGHGIAAAMLSFTIHRLLSSPASRITGRGRIAAERFVTPSEVCRQLNELLPMDTDTRQYATLLYGVIDLRTRWLRLTSAGHCPAVLTSMEEGVTVIRSNGLPIGAFPDVRYEEQVVQLPPRARLHLYSDGLVESGIADDALIEPDWLLPTIEESVARPVEEAVPFILERARVEHGGPAFSDDVSVLVLEID